MGRIKSTLVKRTSKQLIARSTDFDHLFETNKKILGSTMPSKKMRNKIAGYIARLIRMQKEAATKAAKKASSSQTPEYELEAQQ
jgi:small subunit ribosomal protein S17e